MTDHDPMCRQQHWEGGDCFDCRLIARVRADEREQAIVRHSIQREHLRVVMRTDLRAQIEVLRAKARTRDWDYYSALDDVLAVIDRSSNG